MTATITVNQETLNIVFVSFETRSPDVIQESGDHIDHRGHSIKPSSAER